MRHFCYEAFPECPPWIEHKSSLVQPAYQTGDLMLHTAFGHWTYTLTKGPRKHFFPVEESELAAVECRIFLPCEIQRIALFKPSDKRSIAITTSASLLKELDTVRKELGMELTAPISRQELLEIERLRSLPVDLVTTDFDPTQMQSIARYLAKVYYQAIFLAVEQNMPLTEISFEGFYDEEEEDQSA